MSDTPDPTRLMELAKAATPGPWSVGWAEHWHAEGSPACRERCGEGKVPDKTRMGTVAESCEGKVLHCFLSVDHVDDVTAADGSHVVFFGHDYDDYGYIKVEDAAFIAAFNPQTALALLAERAALQAENARLTAALEKAVTLTVDELALVHDALSEVVGRAKEQAAMWEGRSRAPRYQREADEAEVLRARFDALYEARAALTQKGETP